MKGEWRCTAPGLMPLQALAAQAATAFEAVDYAYIPRAENARVRTPRAVQQHASPLRAPTQTALRTIQADALANRAMDLRESFDAVHAAQLPQAQPASAA